MSKHVGIFILAVILVLLLIATLITYQVDENRDLVMVKTFGKLGEPQQGSADAGLHVKWPWPFQQVVRYDKRVHVMEDTYGEQLTADKHSIMVNMFCTWRIKDPQTFHNKLDSEKNAEDALRGQLLAVKRDVIAKHRMRELVNTDPRQMEKIAEIEQEIASTLGPQVQKDFGIEIQRVGLKVLGLNEKVSGSVIEVQKAERQQEAARYAAAGDAQAQTITERAKSASGQIVAFAERKAENIRTEGDRDAAKYYFTFSKNERLSMFLRSLDSLKAELKGRSVFIMNAQQNPAAAFFFQPPSLEAFGPGAGAAPVAVEDKPMNVSQDK